MKRIASISLFLTMIICTTESVFAQKFTKRKRYLSVGLSIGTVNYVGDLDPGNSSISPSFRNTGPAIGLFTGMYRWKPKVSFRGSFSYMYLSGNDFKASSATGDDIFRKARNLNFFNHVVELKADVLYDFIGNKGTYLKRPEYVPYIFTGLAFIYQNPYSRLPDGKGGYEKGSRQRISKMDLETTSFSPVQVIIPMGIGVRKKLNKYWDISFEVGWRWSFTDYLDGVSGLYNKNVDPKYGKYQNMTWADNVQALVVEGGPINNSTAPDPLLPGLNHLNGYNDNSDVEMKNGYSTSANRGNPKDKDWYIVTSFQVTKILKGGVRCPKFR